ncbi:endopolygalacturonase [Massilia sp. CCM 8695]|uniref:Endopolygalacturonase n=1 Tax=Massilia frigida TaxID=2609281 RepID=A0ABX0N8X7_9BURK|nr:glycoside hydrolase family 28 protein [Massilia frigida]NHZ79706.1 endopolygalacturonase [Massilia frigida]
MNKHPIDTRRRALLSGAGAAGLALGGGIALPALANDQPSDPWQKAQAIAASFKTPLLFRKQDFPITAHGAKPCKVSSVKGYTGHHETGMVATPAAGAHDCYPAIRAAIAACAKAGGGRVVIPAGAWLCKGPIVLRSNVHVHLKSGAHVFFSNDPDDFARYGEVDCGPNGKLTLSRWQSNDCLNYSPLVYAHKQNNIALTGEDWTSILDGQGGVPLNGGDCWWDWKSKRSGASAPHSQVAVNPANPASILAVAADLGAAQVRLIEGDSSRWRSDEAYLPSLSEAGVPVGKRVFGRGHYLRPCMIEFIDCARVLLKGYQVNQAPFWLHHPVACRDLEIRQVHMDSMGPNSDGFDPEACDNVLVEDCTFNTGDDCIAIKAGKNLDTQYGPTQNVLIQKCIMNSGHGGVTLGSEMSGGIEHVYAQDIEFRNVNWATSPLATAIRMKTNMNRGGFLKHFYVRNVSMPNGVQTTPQFYNPLPGSPIAPKTVSSSAGAVITIDCDYMPTADNVRTRPPVVSDVHISNVKVGNVKSAAGTFSCYQAIMLLGPVAFDYNGNDPSLIVPITGVTITDCDFGTPANAGNPWFAYNVKSAKLSNVTIGGKVYNTTVTA